MTLAALLDGRVGARQWSWHKELRSWGNEKHRDDAQDSDDSRRHGEAIAPICLIIGPLGSGLPRAYPQPAPHHQTPAENA